MAGFDCASHFDIDNRRIDLTAATRHDEFALLDYSRAQGEKFFTIRDGIRWYLIEKTPRIFDFSSAAVMVRAAETLKLQVIWDLMHYGWPPFLDVPDPTFPERFAEMAGGFAKLFRDESDGVLIVNPINEISYLTWAAEHEIYISATGGRSPSEFKRQLVRAYIAAANAVRQVDPKAIIVATEPLISVSADGNRQVDRNLAASINESQFEACDMMMGLSELDIGGTASHVDVLGLNFYPNNQWVVRHSVGRHQSIPIGRTHRNFRELRELLKNAYRRFGRPIIISETSCEGPDRPAWLKYVCTEVMAAIAEGGVDVRGICWYPILDYPGLNDHRYCDCGLWSFADDFGNRSPCMALREEIHLQRSELRLFLESSQRTCPDYKAGFDHNPAKFPS